MYRTNLARIVAIVMMLSVMAFFGRPVMAAPQNPSIQLPGSFVTESYVTGLQADGLLSLISGAVAPSDLAASAAGKWSSIGDYRFSESYVSYLIANGNIRALLSQ